MGMFQIIQGGSKKDVFYISIADVAVMVGNVLEVGARHRQGADLVAGHDDQIRLVKADRVLNGVDRRAVDAVGSFIDAVVHAALLRLNVGQLQNAERTV